MYYIDAFQPFIQGHLSLKFYNRIVINLLYLLKQSKFIIIYSLLTDTTLLRNSSLTQESDSMNNLGEKSEQHLGDSFFHKTNDQVCKCELQQFDVKPYPYLHQKQDLPDLNFKSELPASTSNYLSQYDQQYQDDKPVVSTQHQENQSDIVMASSKACNG